MNRWFDNIPFISEYVSGKIVLSYLMLMFSVLLGIIFKSNDRAICIFAMFFSFLGDLSLNWDFGENANRKKLFILGGFLFIIAHMFYCFSYYIKMQNNGFKFFNFGVILAIIVTLIVLLIFLLMSNKSKQTKLLHFGMFYLLLTTINYCTVFSYGFSAKSIESICIFGGLSFLASDVIIGCEKFLGLKSRVARELVWWLYPIGQILLISMA